MSPRTLTATLLLLLTMDTMHARPPPLAAAPNATDDAPRLRVRVDERIAVGANEHFGGAAPGPLLQRLRQLGGAAGVNDSEAGAAATAVDAPRDDDADDSTVRSERSTNLSHITGTSRKIQMYIKNRHLQIMPDGTVNGTNDDASDYTIFQRTSVNLGELKIQSVATCLYLCMDMCGLLYGSPQFTEECIFRETIGLDHYNTYTSVRYSNSKKTLYLGLDGRGAPRRVQVPTLRQKRQFQVPPPAEVAAPGGRLGRLATYARVLTRHVTPGRVEEVARRLLLQRQQQQLEAAGAASGGDEEVALRHHGLAHLCPAHTGLVTLPPRRKPLRKCTGRVGPGGGAQPPPAAPKKKQQPPPKKKCSEEEDIEKCKRERRLRQQRLMRKKTAGAQKKGPPAKGPKKGPNGPKKGPTGPKKGPNGPKKGPKAGAVKQGGTAQPQKRGPKRQGVGPKRTTAKPPHTDPPTLLEPTTTLVVTPTPLVSASSSD